MKGNQDEFQKNKQYQGTVRMTRIFTDYRRSLRQLWINRHRDVSSTSTSRNQWEHTGNMSGAVHTGVEVRRMNSEVSGLVEWPWLQLMCCTVCLLCGRNFRWRRESPSGSEYWLVCRRWTPEIEFNKRLSFSIIRLANYSVTTSLIYNWYYRRCSGFQW